MKKLTFKLNSCTKRYLNKRYIHPYKTIKNIQNILNHIMILPDLKIMMGTNEFGSTWNTRVSIYGNRLGTNGKGITLFDSLASGLAELF